MIICGWRSRDNMDPNKSKITNRRISFFKIGEQAPFYTQKLEDEYSVQTQRSMIHPQYARRFIKQFVLKE